MVCRGHPCKGWTGELALVRAPAGRGVWSHGRLSCDHPVACHTARRAAAAGAWTGDATGATPAHRRAGGRV